MAAFHIFINILSMSVPKKKNRKKHCAIAFAEVAYQTDLQSGIDNYCNSFRRTFAPLSC